MNTQQIKSELLKEIEKLDKAVLLQWVMIKIAHDIEKQGVVSINEDGKEELPDVEISFDYTSKISQKRYKANLNLSLTDL